MTEFEKSKPLSRRGKLLLASVIFLVQVPLLHYALFRRSPKPVVMIPFHDDFSDPRALRRNYQSSGGDWRLIEGSLFSPGVKNNPLWLRAALPREVAVEFDVRSDGQEGDIKVEIFGNGMDHGSGYILVHGGWNNSISVIARFYEHGTALSQLREPLRPDSQVRVETRLNPVVPKRLYHWRIERRQSTLLWSIDGKLFLQFDDPFPLQGTGHDRFGFSSWETPLYFDNLSIESL